MPNLSIPYGKSYSIFPLECTGLQIVELKPDITTFSSDFVSNLRESLSFPVGSTPLTHFMREAKKVLLVLSDPTRKLSYECWLHILLEEIRRSISSSSRVFSIIGTGTHRAYSHQNILEFLGTEIDYLIHDCDNEPSLVYLGKSSRGTEFVVNKLLTEVDAIVTTASITFHYFSGFTGGIKAIFPGLGGRDAITYNHSLSLVPQKGEFHPACRPGNLNNNPVYEDFLEIVKLLPPIFSVNVILDLAGNPIAFFSGDPISAHREGCMYYSRHFSARTSEALQYVILSAGGYPRDISLYQAHKALKSVEFALAEQAEIFFFAECTEGLGHPAFHRWEGSTKVDVVKRLKKGYEPLAHLVLSLLNLAEKHNIYVISSLPPDDLLSFGMIPLGKDEIGREIAKSIAISSRSEKIFVQPFGAEVLVSREIMN